LARVRRGWGQIRRGAVAGTLLGTRLFGLAGPGAAALLGAALAAYGAVGLANIHPLRPTASRETWLGPLVGIATGLVTAATGVFVLPAVPYLQALGLEKDDLVQALGLSFTVSTVALGAGLLQAQLLDPALAVASLAALLPAAVGMGLGQLLRVRVSEATFRTAFFAGLLVLGAYALLRSLV
jgi:uncharacterized protein